MTSFRTRTPAEVAELGRLHALDWAVLDTGMGLASGKVFAEDGAEPSRQGQL
ncbi:hypothetical protein [Nocardia sp. NPDC050717]|uniref:hypothetical protein n=1 Tax=Nocardia sp. NPDC050717 TaxID=3157221 RepID=UPI0033EB5178